MSRSKRAKKNKIKIWLPIVCIIIVGITFYMIHDMQNKIEKMDIQNTSTSGKNVENEVTLDENITKNMVEENVVDENIVENATTNETKDITSSNTVDNTSLNNVVDTANVSQKQPAVPTQPGVTDQKQKAIELVKKEWGEDDSVNYSFEYVNENGEYVISVKDRATATIKYYFRVNLDTNQVELD